MLQKRTLRPREVKQGLPPQGRWWGPSSEALLWEEWPPSSLPPLPLGPQGLLGWSRGQARRGGSWLWALRASGPGSAHLPGWEARGGAGVGRSLLGLRTRPGGDGAFPAPTQPGGFGLNLLCDGVPGLRTSCWSPGGEGGAEGEAAGWRLPDWAGPLGAQSGLSVGLGRQR